jgi:hypothetical protein
MAYHASIEGHFPNLNRNFASLIPDFFLLSLSMPSTFCTNVPFFEINSEVRSHNFHLIKSKQQSA